MIWQISIREGMKAAEQRMKELQKLIENGENYLQYIFPVHSKHHRLACFAKNGSKKAVKSFSRLTASCAVVGRRFIQFWDWLGGSTSCYSAARQMLFVAMLFLNARSCSTKIIVGENSLKTDLYRIVAAVIGICCSVTLWYMSIDTSNKTVREITDAAMTARDQSFSRLSGSTFRKLWKKKYGWQTQVIPLAFPSPDGNKNPSVLLPFYYH